jgi:hypothetical protein
MGAIAESRQPLGDASCAQDRRGSKAAFACLASVSASWPSGSCWGPSTAFPMIAAAAFPATAEASDVSYRGPLPRACSMVCSHAYSRAGDFHSAEHLNLTRAIGTAAGDNQRSLIAPPLKQQTRRTGHRLPTADGDHLGVRFLAQAPVRTRSILFASCSHETPVGWRDHWVVLGQAPSKPIFLGSEVVQRLQMAREQRELRPFFQADDVIYGHRVSNRDGWLHVCRCYPRSVSLD